MTSSGAAVSEHESSPCRMRSPQSLAASFAAVWGVSSWLTPMKTSRPGSPMAATTRWSTVTAAWLTRCTTARTLRRLLLLTSPNAVKTGHRCTGDAWRDSGEVPADDLRQPGEVGVDAPGGLAGGDRQAGGVQREVPGDRRTARLVRPRRCRPREADPPRERPARRHRRALP